MDSKNNAVSHASFFVSTPMISAVGGTGVISLPVNTSSSVKSSILLNDAGIESVFFTDDISYFINSFVICRKLINSNYIVIIFVLIFDYYENVVD